MTSLNYAMEGQIGSQLGKEIFLLRFETISLSSKFNNKNLPSFDPICPFIFQWHRPVFERPHIPERTVNKNKNK